MAKKTSFKTILRGVKTTEIGRETELSYRYNRIMEV